MDEVRVAYENKYGGDLLLEGDDTDDEDDPTFHIDTCLVRRQLVTWPGNLET